VSRPQARYRLTEVEKSTVKAEMREAMIAAAKARQLLTYTDLALALPSVYLNPGSFVFAHLMREVCRAEWEQSGTMLCALVVSRLTGIPGAGYFRGMAALGEDVSDAEAAWRAEVERAFDYWSEA
jgi:hypothetical protein